MLLIKSTSDAPALNGELERKYLTECPAKDVLLFYINRPSVIVGCNQSIEAEVNTLFCQQHDIEIYKRVSGGGAVYHDYGNINYAFITPKGETSVLEIDFATPIITALYSLGIKAIVGARKELLVNNKKISGTASHITRDRILFHGTLLHQTNLYQLNQTLQGNESVRGKYVASIPSPVVNLNDLIQSNESTEQFLNRLLHFFEAYYQTTAQEV